VIAASGLKYVGLGTTALGWTLCAMLFAAGAVWLAYIRPNRASESLDEPLRTLEEPIRTLEEPIGTVRAPIEPAGID
jgi:hypothetical protein